MTFSWIGRSLAAALTRQRHVHGANALYSEAMLLACLQPGDVLLVEGNNRVGSVIKYLTQSTWSHSALYVGDDLPGGDAFIEADIVAGVRSVGMDEFSGLHARICRPIGLSQADARKVCDFAVKRIGSRYDLRNVVDLARYFLPNFPIPPRFRRQFLAIGSGDPTRAICSTLIAQAFQSIHYPILPSVSVQDRGSPDCPGCVQEVYRIRHHSLFTPRDFDVSPYFRIVKPLQSGDFDYKSLQWQETDG
ncbi:MAG: hypothetical protein R8L58_01235 [Mariprofundaceae bacterium]